MLSTMRLENIIRFSCLLLLLVILCGDLSGAAFAGITTDCIVCICKSKQPDPSADCTVDGEGVACSNDSLYCGPLYITHEVFDISGVGQAYSGITRNDCAVFGLCIVPLLYNYFNVFSCVDCNKDGVVNCLDYGLLLEYGPDVCYAAASQTSTVYGNLKSCVAANNITT